MCRVRNHVPRPYLVNFASQSEVKLRAPSPLPEHLQHVLFGHDIHRHSCGLSWVVFHNLINIAYEGGMSPGGWSRKEGHEHPHLPLVNSAI
jgi:hypothetical protein